MNAFASLVMALDLVLAVILLSMAWDEELELSHAACFGTWTLILTLFVNGITILMVVNGWNLLRIFS